MKKTNIIKRSLAAFLALAAVLPAAAGCVRVEPIGPGESTGTETRKDPAQTDPKKETHGDAESGHAADTARGTEPGGEETDAPTVGVYDVIINEIIADNRFVDGTNFCDWIELHNREEFDVLLDGYYLTDTDDTNVKLSLEGKKIKAGGYLLVVLDEYAQFHLSSSGESVALVRNGEIGDILTYTEEIGSSSFSHEGICEYQTPGFDNTQKGFDAMLDSVTLPALRITEVLSSNGKFLPDKNGDCYDIVEICNTSSEPVSLKGYTLSDKFKEPERFALPDKTLEAGEYLVVYCSGLEKEGHAPFKISSAGETVYLFRDGALHDAVNVPGGIKKDYSYGREGNRFVYMNEPTPGKKNAKGISVNVTAPAASVPAGQYETAQTVKLSGVGKIYYTTDGTHPTTSSKVYTEPIEVKNAVTTIRAFAVEDGFVGEEAAYTYLIGVSHTLPIVSVSIPMWMLRGDNGILDQIDKKIEKEGQLTMFENGKQVFTIPVGFRLHGNDSRKGKKQNFQLRFRSEYGQSKLKYKVFDDLDIDEFKSLLLKGGSEDYGSAMLRDELATSIVTNGATHLYAQAYKPVILYLGGEYWGVYYLRERYSEDYVASHLGVDKDSVDLIAYYGSVEAGSVKQYNALLEYCSSHDLRVEEYCKYVTDRIDLTSLMDWYICRAYLGDKDFANIRYFRSSESDNKWRWMWFDLDWSFWHTTDKPMANMLKNDYRNKLMWPLMRNPDVKDKFLKRYAELMNTILNEEFILARLDLIYNTIKPEMEQDRKRWGYSMNGWESAIKTVRNYVKDGARDRHVLEELQSYFGLSNEEMRSYFGSKYGK